MSMFWRRSSGGTGRGGASRATKTGHDEQRRKAAAKASGERRRQGGNSKGRGKSGVQPDVRQPNVARFQQPCDRHLYPWLQHVLPICAQTTRR